MLFNFLLSSTISKFTGVPCIKMRKQSFVTPEVVNRTKTENKNVQIGSAILAPGGPNQTNREAIITPIL